MHAGKKQQGVKRSFHFSGEPEDLKIAFNHKIWILSTEKCGKIIPFSLLVVNKNKFYQ